MKTKNPTMGIMHIIRTMKDKMVNATHPMETGTPLCQNMTVCPAWNSLQPDTSNIGSLNQQP